MAANNITILSDGLRRLSFQFTGTATDLLNKAGEDDQPMSEDTPILGSTGVEIDIDLINKSLDHVNNFSKRRNTDKLPPVLMYEICSSGESSYKSITLRELLNTVNDEANEIDAASIVEAAKRLKSDEKSQSQQVDTFRPYSIPRDSSPATTRQNPSPTTTINGHRRLGDSKTVYESRYNIPIVNHSQHNHSSDSPCNNNDESYDATGGLRLRDLRRLDFQFNPNEERSVLIRRHAVLFAMDPIRAVVMADRLILIVPDGADSLIAILDRYMQEWVSHKGTQGCAEDLTSSPKELPHAVQQSFPSSVTESINSDSPRSTAHTSTGSTMGKIFRKMSMNMTTSAHDQLIHDMTQASNPAKAYVNSKTSQASANDLPFEMHAFEALLTTVMALETQEYNKVNAQVQTILGYFRSGWLLPIEVQEKMRNRKNDLSVMMRRISSARNTINVLTEDDEEMALMSLTTLKDKPSLYRYPLMNEILSKHDEMEELLESYLIDFTSLESKIDSTRSQIQTAEELLSLRLDTSRNELLIANTVLAILSICCGLGAYVSGIFGMNLDNTQRLQRTPHVFYIVIATSFGGMILLFFMFVLYFRSNGMFPARIALQHKDGVNFKALL